MVRAARSRIPPTTITVREATVGPEPGTRVVSGSITTTMSVGRPSASAAICASTIDVPWPKSLDETRTSTRSGSSSSMRTGERIFSSPSPVNPAPCQESARPMPGSESPPPRARALRAEGWVTVAGLAPDRHPDEEARHLRCSHILRDDRVAEV